MSPLMAGMQDGPAIDVLARQRPAIDAAMRRVLDVPRELDPAHQATIRYAIEAGGKRLRPLLCLAAFRAAGGRDAPGVYDAACALEIIHSYSLVHDDLPCMDDDELRRGRPTAHRVHGEAAAAVAGAVMIPLAFEVLEQAVEGLGFTPRERRLTLAELAAGAGAAGMVGGQVLDLAAEGAPVTVVELEAIHRRKTGALFASACRLGGRLARAAETVVAALGDCGRALGLAFQVTDDLLDVTGKAAVLGKTAGSDKVHGKATYPALLGVETARLRAHEAAADARQALRQAGVRDDTLEYLIDFAVSRDR